MNGRELFVVVTGLIFNLLSNAYGQSTGGSAHDYLTYQALTKANAVKIAEFSRDKMDEYSFYRDFVVYGGAQHLSDQVLGSSEFADRIENLNAYWWPVEENRILAVKQLAANARKRIGNNAVIKNVRAIPLVGQSEANGKSNTDDIAIMRVAPAPLKPTTTSPSALALAQIKDVKTISLGDENALANYAFRLYKEQLKENVHTDWSGALSLTKSLATEFDTMVRAFRGSATTELDLARLSFFRLIFKTLFTAKTIHGDQLLFDPGALNIHERIEAQKLGLKTDFESVAMNESENVEYRAGMIAQAFTYASDSIWSASFKPPQEFWGALIDASQAGMAVKPWIVEGIARILAMRMLPIEIGVMYDEDTYSRDDGLTHSRFKKFLSILSDINPKLQQQLLWELANNPNVEKTKHIFQERSDNQNELHRQVREASGLGVLNGYWAWGDAQFKIHQLSVWANNTHCEGLMESVAPSQK